MKSTFVKISKYIDILGEDLIGCIDKVVLEDDSFT